MRIRGCESRTRRVERNQLLFLSHVSFQFFLVVINLVVPNLVTIYIELSVTGHVLHGRALLEGSSGSRDS